MRTKNMIKTELFFFAVLCYDFDREKIAGTGKHESH